jgi:hypothetical protein
MMDLKNVVALAVLCLVLGGLGCGVDSERAHVYDYSPTVVQSGEVRQIWWCGLATNPTDKSQYNDAILYKSINLKTNKSVGPTTVLAETKGAWDSVYTCNPKVVKGTFINPLGDDRTYSYAMYYVATGNKSGNENNIGVAFSNDGIVWNKYPQPVIKAASPVGYGVAQPAIYNSNGKGAIWMFYEDDFPFEHHVAATSTDGLHFVVQGTLTTAGLDPDTVLGSWGDMAYDYATDHWYAAFNRPGRDPSTTGGIIERGQLGIVLYRIPGSSIFSGATPWQELHTFDTNLTGSEENFIAGFVRDQFGNVNVGDYPTIQMYLSISNPSPDWNASPTDAANSAQPNRWDLGSVTWTPNHPLMALKRYANSTTHEVTTGWVTPEGDFTMQMTLGHLYESPQQGATVPFYGCKRGSTDYFVSLDEGCEGARMLGKNGYGYAHSVAGLNLVPLFRCSTKTDHFVSTDAKCEGQTTDQLLGYAMP